MMGPQGPGKKLGAYQLGAFLGAGPVGDVFRAQKGMDTSEFVVKLLRAPYVNSPNVRQRFLAISATIAQLDHPHILPIDHSGEQGGNVFVALPFVAQGSLMGRLAAGRLSPKDIAPLFNQICDALNAIHGQGMTHGNLKPTNILLFEGKHCLLSDFGLLWQITEVDLTHSGVSTDAVLYMAPEQMEGYVDIRTDIYSLGAMLFHALTGAPPFTGKTPFEVLSRHQRQPVPSLANMVGQLPPGALVFEDVIRMALAKDPAARFQTPVAMARAIVEAGNQANDLPSRVIPIITPGMQPPGMGAPMLPAPNAPPQQGGTNPGFGPMPGQMIPAPNPNGRPAPGPLPVPGQMPFPGQMPMPGPSSRPNGPLFGTPGSASLPPGPAMPIPGQMPPPGMPLPQPGPGSRPRIPSQPIPGQMPPPGMMPPPGQLPPQAPADDPLSWLLPQPGGPNRPTPAPPNLGAADFLTARHSAPDLSQDAPEHHAPPTIETEMTPRSDDRWYDNDDDEYDDRDYTGDQSRISPRDWDDESRSMSVPSMRTPSRPSSRDRWEESDEHYRPRDDDGYSREMSAPQRRARGQQMSRPREMYSSRDDNYSMMGPAIGPTQASLVIPAAKKRRGSRLPLILGIFVIIVLLANVVLISVVAPQRCPSHLCDSLHNKLAPLFGLQPATTVTLSLLTHNAQLSANIGGNTTQPSVLSLSTDATNSIPWSAKSDLAWVGFTPASGTLAPGQTATIGLTLAPDGTVTPGTYTATVTITAGASTAQIKVPITVNPSAGS